jgi:hypothetical protein
MDTVVALAVGNTHRRDDFTLEKGDRRECLFAFVQS